MKFFAAILLLCAALLLQACTPISLATTGVGVASSKHGWFDVNSRLTEPHHIRKPEVPFNLSLHTRILIQGMDLDGDGALENSVEWYYREKLLEQLNTLFAQTGIALITDRGLDGSVYVEVSDRMEEFGMRYIPFLPSLRWTERKIGKMRITFINSSGKKVTSGLQEENLYVRTGVLSDEPNASYKQKAFEIPRMEYTLKGDFVGLEQLDEQLFFRCIEKIQKKIALESFFGTPDDVPDEPHAPDPKEGWHYDTGGEAKVLESAVQMPTSAAK